MPDDPAAPVTTLTLSPTQLSPRTVPLGSGGLWEWVAAATQGRALRLELPAPDGMKQEVRRLSELAATFRLIAGSLSLADQAGRVFQNEVELAKLVADPLYSAASVGAARVCLNCHAIWDARIAPGLERPELGPGICPHCGRKYDVEGSKREADRLLLAPAETGPWRTTPPPTSGADMGLF